MSETEGRIGEMREKLGYDAAKKGQAPHGSASREFEGGYRRASLGFGTNVAPRNFGKGGEQDTGWTCVCGHQNLPHRRWMRGGEELCWNCGVARLYSEDKEQ